MGGRLIVSQTDDDLTRVLGDFLIKILPDGTPVLVSQINRVPEVHEEDFVLMTPTRRRRIETNTDSYLDCAFIAFIHTDQMTVTEIKFGTLEVGHVVFGVGIEELPTILVQVSGPTGGVGVYQLSANQSDIASETMATGVQDLMQPTEVTVQLDVHGPKGADNCQVISTLFRDDYAVQYFRESALDASPLYADEPKQVPFLNGEQQWETRWVIEAVMQANQRVTVSQQFAEAIVIGLTSVDSRYPA